MGNGDSPFLAQFLNRLADDVGAEFVVELADEESGAGGVCNCGLDFVLAGVDALPAGVLDLTGGHEGISGTLLMPRSRWSWRTYFGAGALTLEPSVDFGAAESPGGAQLEGGYPAGLGPVVDRAVSHGQVLGYIVQRHQSFGVCQGPLPVIAQLLQEQISTEQ